MKVIDYSFQKDMEEILRVFLKRDIKNKQKNF